MSASNEEWFQSVDDDDDDCRSESGGEDEEDDNGEDLLADILAQDAFETTSTSTLASNAGAGKRTESTDRTLAGQLALNPTKAGLAGVDRQLVNSKILEVVSLSSNAQRRFLPLFPLFSSVYLGKSR